MIPDHAVCFWQEGSLCICADGDFETYETSPVGYGATWDEALRNLNKECKKLRALNKELE